MLETEVYKDLKFDLFEIYQNGWGNYIKPVGNKKSVKDWVIAQRAAIDEGFDIDNFNHITGYDPVIKKEYKGDGKIPILEENITIRNLSEIGNYIEEKEREKTLEEKLELYKDNSKIFRITKINEDYYILPRKGKSNYPNWKKTIEEAKEKGFILNNSNLIVDYKIQDLRLLEKVKPLE